MTDTRKLKKGQMTLLVLNQLARSGLIIWCISDRITSGNIINCTNIHAILVSFAMCHSKLHGLVHLLNLILNPQQIPLSKQTDDSINTCLVIATRVDRSFSKIAVLDFLPHKSFYSKHRVLSHIMSHTMSYRNRVLYKLVDLLSKFPKWFAPNHKSVCDAKSHLSRVGVSIQFVEKLLVLFAVRIQLLLSN